MDIAVIGSNMVDLITYTNQMPKEGETLEAPAFKIGCGGKGANQAVAVMIFLRIILFVILNHGELIPLMLRRSPVPAVVLHRSLLMPTRAIVY